jgi:hypothetical protein
LGEVFDNAHKEGRDGIHGVQGNVVVLTVRAGDIHVSYLEQQYLLEMVEARRNADKVEERCDLFSGLLDAARDEPDSKAALTDEELIGRI